MWTSWDLTFCLPEVSPEDRAQNVGRVLQKEMCDVESEWARLQGALIDWQQTLEHRLQRLLELYKTEEHLEIQLKQAEMVKESWDPVGDLLIHSLQEHIDSVKVRVHNLNTYTPKHL